MKTLFLSPLHPKMRGGWGGGGYGGYPGFVSFQVPTSEAPVSADTHAFARLPPGRLRKNRNLRGLGGFCGEAPGPWRAGPQALGARAPSPLETWPTGPWGLDPAFLTSCCVKRVRVSKPLTLGGVGWFPKAELYSSMMLGRAPSPCKPGQQAPEPCIPVKNSKNAPVLIGS